jgi:HPt (histidine-containing phosphotransfer) domain-containing protein
MNDYLTKPLHVAALAQALERWLPQMTSAAVDSGRPEKPLPAPARAIDASGWGGARTTKPSPLPVPEMKLMDMERLAQFKEFDDDHLTMTREVIGLFIADASQRLDAIDQSIRAGDPAALAWATHALIGATGNVGAVAMQAVCAELELAAKTGGVPADAPQQFEKLQSYWTQTRAVLNTWV